jgi:hypothetical protein
MPFKPNYNQQRVERDRAKAKKKQDKRKRLEEESAARKAVRGDAGSSGTDPQDVPEQG